MAGSKFNLGQILAIFLAISGFSLACPNACQCSSLSDPKIIEISSAETSVITTSCENSHLSGVPEIPANTEFLNFSGNSLTYLNEMTFRGRQYLEMMDFSNNSIETIGKQTFAGLKNLKKIDLNWNQLSSLHSEVFAGLESKNVVLDVTGNPLHCNCRFKRAWDQIFSKPGISAKGGTCSSPEEYKGEVISGLDKICEDKLNGHDITLIILAALTVILATIFNFSSPLKRTVVSCQTNICGQSEAQLDCPERIKNVLISSKSTRDPEWGEKMPGTSQHFGQPMITVAKRGSYTIDETSLSNSTTSALDFFSKQNQQGASGSSQSRKPTGNNPGSSGSSSSRKNWSPEGQTSSSDSRIQMDNNSSRCLEANFSGASELNFEKSSKETQI